MTRIGLFEQAVELLRVAMSQADVHEPPEITMTFATSRDLAYFERQIKNEMKPGGPWTWDLNTDTFTLRGIKVGMKIKPSYRGWGMMK